MDSNGPKIKDLGDAKKYVDLDGMTTDKLRFGLWYVEHLSMFRHLLIIVLAFIAAITWTYTIYHYSSYIIVGMDDDDRMVGEMLSHDLASRNYLVNSAPADLEIFPAGSVMSGDKMDFFVKVRNPNGDYSVSFAYYFTVGAGKTGKKQTFILPGEEKYVMALGEDARFGASGVRMAMENIVWRKINRHEINDWQAYRNDHLDIAIDGIKYLPDVSSGLSDKITLNKLEFTAANNTAYGYWHTGFLAVLLGSGEDVVAVNSFSLPEFKSGDTRKIEIVWPGDLPPVSRILITPEVDVFDGGNYMKF